MHWFYVLHVGILLFLALRQFQIQKRLDAVAAAAAQVVSIGDIDV